MTAKGENQEMRQERLRIYFGLPGLESFISLDDICMLESYQRDLSHQKFD